MSKPGRLRRPHCRAASRWRSNDGDEDRKLAVNVLTGPIAGNGDGIARPYALQREVNSDRKTHCRCHRLDLFLRLACHPVRGCGSPAAARFSRPGLDRRGGSVCGVSAGCRLCGMVPGAPPAAVALGGDRRHRSGAVHCRPGAAPALRRRAVDPALCTCRLDLVRRAGSGWRRQCVGDLWLERCNRQGRQS